MPYNASIYLKGAWAMVQKLYGAIQLADRKLGEAVLGWGIS